MGKKIKKNNISKLLKDCPKGTKLYSPLCGECYFDRLNMGTIICKKQNTQEITFTSEGYYMLPVFDDCECVIFPSKECRDWSKFQRPFKDGDILISGLDNCGNNPFIFKQTNGIGNAQCYCAINCFEQLTLNNDNWTPIKGCRLATEEEKQKLFQVIEDNGYKWNAETKTLEEVIKPKFNIGDKVKKNRDTRLITIKDIKDNYYIITIPDYFDNCYVTDKLLFSNQNNYELVPNKFDISNLKPFESKVLVRDNDSNSWYPAIFGCKISTQSIYKYVTMTGKQHAQCIPYEGNEHLLGTTDDCDEYYKSW